MNILPKLQEEFTAKIPALTLLTNLGWNFLSPQQALAARDGKDNEVILREVLRKELQKRHFSYAGVEHPFSEKSIDNVINTICAPPLNNGLTAANQAIYNHLMYGISVTEFIDGKKTDHTIQLIDWHRFDNNSFLFTEEFSIVSMDGLQTRRPDIVCFVNGIPFVVIEAKRPDSRSQEKPTIEEGVLQQLRNQQINFIPHLFAYSQILLSINGAEGLYGTQGTQRKFWSVWFEEDITDNEFHLVKNKILSSAQLAALFDHRPVASRQHYEQLLAGGELAVTPQDKLIISLLSPQRLLEMTRYFIIFDQKAGKIIARYPQVFGIKRLIDRINTRRKDNGRESGVIWHTTGSGKSFTMVFLSKALVLYESLKQCRIIVITDRIELEGQLSNTFLSSGEFSKKRDKEAAMATSGRSLAMRIGKGTERFIFSLIQKFNTAAKLPECYNDSADIIVLVDEGHRSQGGENHTRMRVALPKAAFIAFTGTPLLKDDKTTNKFGPIIHPYTMQRAIDDKAVTPLLYEERQPDLDVNDRAIDSWFERITKNLTEEQRIDLKKKFAKKGQIFQADDRIRLIAFDIAQHFKDHIMPYGLKGQLACDSKLAAIRYKQYLDEIGYFESAVVISAPDKWEGNLPIDESTIPQVTQWWQTNVGNQAEQIYTKKVIDQFDKDVNLKLLIVVDKLLTGFDEPKNAVLYIDKSLKAHNLIQAVARVNRLYENKKFGLLIAYRGGILQELDTTIQKYQDLANRTQGGFEIDDLIGLYHQVSTEYKKLPQLYDTIWAIFKNVKNKTDTEQLRQVLIPKVQEIDGEMIDVNLKTREDFYIALNEFANCLRIALQSVSYFEDNSFTDAERDCYKMALQQFSGLRETAKRDAGETIAYGEYTSEVKALVDKHVVGVQIKESSGIYAVSEMGRRSKPEEWSPEKTRNETDIIKTRVTKMIEQDLRDDPYAQEAFSKLLRQAIKEAEELFDYPLKQYYLFDNLKTQVEQRKLDDIPNSFNDNHRAQAYYGALKKALPNTFTFMLQEEQQKWIDLSFAIDTLVKISVTENSINPQNIEANIRKKLLPLLFKECKAAGTGTAQAKTIVEMIVQINRVSWSTW